MEKLIERHDFDGLKEFVKQAKRNGEDEELLQSQIDYKLRNFGLAIAEAGCKAVTEGTFQQHFAFTLELANAGLCSKTTPVLTIQDITESSSIRTCEAIFTVIEQQITVLKQPLLNEASQTNILRLCNDLLRRLSRTAETSFCGRILFFLSRFLPLGEKSGLNLMGHFNTQNATKYETDSETGFVAPTTVEDVETGEIEDNKDSSIPIDHKIYSSFWSMQEFLSNPNIIYDKEKFVVFKKYTSEIFALFASYKLDRSSDDTDKSSRKKKSFEIEGRDRNNKEDFFAKYLTSPKLFALQLNDSQFRRHFLCQCVVVFQYLTADVKFKTSGRNRLVLNEEQAKYVSESEEKCYKLLCETQPRGSQFADCFKRILKRENEWSNWKNAGCTDITENADKGAMQMYRKRQRESFDPNVSDLGNAELTRLWNVEPGLLAACRNPKRKYTPSLKDFIAEPLEQMDPDGQVEEEYYLPALKDFQWRASRLLVNETSYYMPKVKEREQTTSLKEFLEYVIYNTAKELDEFKEEIFAREKQEAEARRRVEMSMKKTLDLNSDLGKSSPNPNEGNLNSEKIEVIAKALVRKTKQLAAALGKDVPEAITIDDEGFCSQLLQEWAETHNNSIRELRNHLLSTDPEVLMVVTAALKPQGSGF